MADFVKLGGRPLHRRRAAVVDWAVEDNMQARWRSSR